MSVTEQELIDAAVAPRVTEESLEANIVHEAYFTAYEGVLGEQFNHEKSEGPEGDFNTHPSLKLLTICVLTTQNGFTFLGQSACASPENFNQDIGRRLARKDAVGQIWSHMGYELRSLLAEQEVFNKFFPDQASAPAKGGVADRQAEGHDAVGTGSAQADLDHLIYQAKPLDIPEAPPVTVETIDADTSRANTSDPYAGEDD